MHSHYLVLAIQQDYLHFMYALVQYKEGKLLNNYICLPKMKPEDAYIQ